MKLRASDLWRWDRTIGRGEYVVWGALLLQLKLGLDYLIAKTIIGKSLSVLEPANLRLYLWQDPAMKSDNDDFLIVMVITSLPFMWACAALTFGRLRSIGWSNWWVFLFFVPVVKLVFFALLSLIPARVGPDAIDPAAASAIDETNREISHSAFKSGMMALLAGVAVTPAMIWFGVEVLATYGIALFLFMPFGVGTLSALFFSFHKRRTLGECVRVACVSMLLAAAAILLFAFEGIICILMAAPLALGAASLGGVLGYAMQDTIWLRSRSQGTLCVVLLLMPCSMLIEHAVPPPLPVFEVKSSIIVNAPADVVWRFVVSFPELPPPRELIFRTGIAYPTHATIEGDGVGAIRNCHFTTGKFVEPIEVWDPPRRLKFSVTSHARPMHEWSPYGAIQPPHLEGYFVTTAGEFLLTPLDDGRTRIDGTTWYYNRMWPANYWRLWSDLILHAIHERVLTHIKDLAEK